MIPAGFQNVEGQLLIWMVAMLRPGAAFLAAPMFGANAVPVQLRLVLALAVGIPSAAMVNMTLPAAGIISLPGFFMIVSEVMAGLAMGFVIQIAFAAALVAGEAISNTMGLGFASMADPASGQSSPAIGQFLSMLTMFLFLAADGHLALIATIAESYRALPPGEAWLSFSAIGGIVKFGSLAFSAGLSIALPVGFALVLVQLIMATRNATAYSDKLASWIGYGASPRATIAVERCARAKAWLDGRDFVTPDDVQAVFHNALRHRLILTYAAEAEGISTDDVLAEILRLVPAA